MSGGWEGSTRRDELPPNWQSELRPFVLQRDGYRCRWHEDGPTCGHHANQVDHIEPGNDHRPENLQALCAYHHKIKTSREGNAARWRETARRPPERHPGLI
ncbi:HNH endonuclease [Streptomyces sp. A1136]|uniref:HNH endonuclease n=1 Tax=Streptomyces sp. A1136 TaxID=2563102 RepID=UPI00109EDE4E|nr:HNH endonuclease signature motif containing protein [Streptomyces sp. A1136]THA56114.1 HNH endonuclease [Streptomyces sp. A1136]